ncbi:MAG TPA: hypothetical protein G4N92_09400 [Anaerolineae bacterium]|nr:hypothetical protein [Anaerolineae bacterium]
MAGKQKPSHPNWTLTLGIGLALVIFLLGSGMLLWLYINQSGWMATQPNQEIENLQLEETQNEPSATPFMPLPTTTATPSFTPTVSVEPTFTPTITPTRTAAPTQGEIPDSAYISGVVGRPQLYTLDCEARSAVDWARFFGVNIDEQEFIDRTPLSDDPEEGFVGDVNSAMGQFPPDDYGVHPPPVATLLREYNLDAWEVVSMSYEDLQSEIAAGRPVIVWIVNLPFEIDTTIYIAPNGNSTVVARFEHTWIVTGYNRYTVTVIDSKWTYNVKLQNFLDRWAALGNRAIVMREQN